MTPVFISTGYLSLAATLFFSMSCDPAHQAQRPATQPAATATKADTPDVKSPVFDDLGQFHKIVFLNSADSSMIVNAISLEKELQMAIDLLSSEQSFNIMFFADATAALQEFAAKDLLPATPDNRQYAAKFLWKATFTGIADPIPAMTEAFRQRPDAIYLVSEGSFPDDKLVASTIRDLNKGCNVKVYTILLAKNPEAAEADGGRDVLQTIAKENGGKFKLVISPDLPGYKAATARNRGKAELVATERRNQFEWVTRMPIRWPSRIVW